MTGVTPGTGDAAAAGLYVHVPFCEKLCHYCDFNTYLLRDGGVDEYLSALEKEIELYARDGAGCPSDPFVTLFIGGGTPTALTAPRLARLLDGLRRGFSFADAAEVTIEANPGTLIDRRLRTLRDGGVNRLSIGVQSLNDGLLGVLGRIHDARQARECYDRARRLGFDNVSVDLMFGLPGQDVDDWRRTLTEVAAWEPDHISCYNLIVEEGTPFGRWRAEGRLPLPDEQTELDMYRFAMEHLADRGYEHYEISNWAKPGRQSRHNRLYWLNGRWLGLGPGAHSQWGGRRFRNVRLPGEYAARLQAGRPPVDETSEESVSRKIAMEDTVILGLRLREGVSAQAFRDRFGVELEDEFRDEINRFAAAGLLEWRGEGRGALGPAAAGAAEAPGRRLRLTDEGLFVSNQVLQHFIR